MQSAIFAIYFASKSKKQPGQKWSLSGGQGHFHNKENGEKNPVSSVGVAWNRRPQTYRSLKTDPTDAAERASGNK